MSLSSSISRFLHLPSFPLGSLFVCLLTAGPILGQDSQGVLNGRILLGGEGLGQVMVSLHRVTMEESGVVDSLRTGPTGDFRFVLPSVPTATNAHEVYFAAVSVDEILYFGAPISDAAALDSLYVVEAFPTRAVDSTPPILPLDDRSLIAEPNETGGWLVTDIFNVRNEGGETWVTVEGRPVWRYPLPEGASGMRVGQSDLAPDAVSFEGGEIAVTSPIPPGKRMYMIQYLLPDLDMELRLPGRVDQFSLLVREPGPDLEVSGLLPQPPAEIQPGAIFRHYLGMGLNDASISVAAAAQGPISRFGVEWLAVIIAFVMGGAGILAYQRGRSHVPPVVPIQDLAPSGGPSRQDLLMEIAHLDEAFEANPSPSDSDQVEYQRRRDALTALVLGGGG